MVEYAGAKNRDAILPSAQECAAAVEHGIAALAVPAQLSEWPLESLECGALQLPDGTFAWVSESFAACYRYTPEQMIRRNAYDFIHPDDFDALTRIHQTILDVPDVVHIEMRFMASNTEFLPMNVMTVNLGPSHNGIYYTTIGPADEISRKPNYRLFRDGAFGKNLL